MTDQGCKKRDGKVRIKQIIAKRKPGGHINGSQKRPQRKVFLEIKSHSLITKGIIHEEYIIALS